MTYARKYLVTRPKIMLISGDMAARRSLEQSLEASPLEPWVVAGDWSDLDQVAKLDPGLLILDNRSYHGDMLETLRRLRRQFQFPLLVLGRYGRHMIDVLEAGADFYLSPPFSPHLFLARVEVLLRRSNIAKGTYSRVAFNLCTTCKVRLARIGTGLTASETGGRYRKNALWSKLVVLSHPFLS